MTATYRSTIHTEGIVLKFIDRQIEPMAIVAPESKWNYSVTDTWLFRNALAIYRPSEFLRISKRWLEVL